MFQMHDRMTHIFQDQLYRNSMFMVMSRFLNAGVGFLFWLIAAKLYSIREVGTATALFSSLGLVMLFSKCGFDISLVRFIANTDRNKAFNTSLVITAAASVGISLVYLLLVRLLQVSLALNPVDTVLFILIAVSNSISLMTGNMFMALRKGRQFFIQTVIISLRIFLLFPLAYFKDFGILLSLGVCYAISALFSLWVLRKEVKLNFLQIDIPFIKESFKYSIQSYISNIFTEAPILLLPIMVLHLIGQEEAAKYYIAMSLGNLTLIVPNSLSFSLFVEGSRGQPIKQNVMKVCTSAYLSLVPILFVISLWGKNILGFISKDYIDAYGLLLLIIVASFFAVIYLVFVSVQNINMRVDRNIGFNLLRFVLLIGASFYLVPRYRINGVGYAWLATHAILTIGIAAIYVRTYIKAKSRISMPVRTNLTTGPVVRNVAAKRLLVVVLNTTCSDYEIRVFVNDVTKERKPAIEKSLQIKGSFTETLTLPKPPVLYEVLFENVPPGVLIWTSTSSSVYETYLIESNTFHHKDLITTPGIENGTELKGST